MNTLVNLPAEGRHWSETAFATSLKGTSVALVKVRLRKVDSTQTTHVYDPRQAGNGSYISGATVKEVPQCELQKPNGEASACRIYVIYS